MSNLGDMIDSMWEDADSTAGTGYSGVGCCSIIVAIAILFCIIVGIVVYVTGV